MLKDYYFTVMRTATVLGVTRQTIFHYLVSGTLKAKVVGRTKLIPKHEILSILYDEMAKTQAKIDLVEGESGLKEG